jgi:site-specific recombinase XerD
MKLNLISFFLLLAGAGLRAGKLVAIRVEDIDFSKGFLQVPKGRGNKCRAVILLPAVTMALQAYLHGRSHG